MNITLKEVEELIKTDNPLIAYQRLQEYEGDDIDLLYWKKKVAGYVAHAFNRDVYDTFYGDLDEYNTSDADVLRMDRILPRTMFTSMFLEDYPDHKTLVDVGCATGENTLFFGSKGYEVTGINLSKESIKLAEAKAKRLDIDAKFICSNFMDVDGLWDIVLFQEVFEHVPDPRKAIEKLWSFVIPGGLLFVSTPKPNFWGVHGNDDKWQEDGLRGHLKLYSEEELRNILSDFNIIKFYEDQGELYNVVCQR